ncbi:MAG: DNA polymerase III [candidate division WS6 bacterium 34_10]|uniref:DNA polymerase III n=1 Tax=candidate division WS6 bacterium 34_10 TaxID=1641389 RepID=A0A101HGN3_9BACT|nr:MAG: DNA polymerase III [candidate division WS6 bacterium 34_10]
MTYIIANKKERLQKQELKRLLLKLFGKEISDSPDIHILNPEDKNSIGIEEVKELQQSMRFKPFQEEVQVGIILNAQKLTHQAQNSMLKSLEDSSETSVYILCVDNEKNLLPTIRSRGVILYPKREEGGEGEVPVDKSDIENVMETFFDLSPIEQFNIIEEYSENKEISLTFINGLEETLREELELDIKNGNIDSSQRNLEFLKVVEKSREKISSNCNRKLTLEAMIMQLKT